MGRWTSKVAVTMGSMAVALIICELGIVPSVWGQLESLPVVNKVKCECNLSTVQCPAQFDCPKNWGHYCETTKDLRYTGRCNRRRNQMYCSDIPFEHACQSSYGSTCGKKYDCMFGDQGDGDCGENKDECGNRLADGSIYSDPDVED